VGKLLRVTQVRSYIGRPEKQRRVLRGLGLGKMNRTVVLQDTPQVRGMIQKVRHLVTVAEGEGVGHEIG